MCHLLQFFQLGEHAGLFGDLPLRGLAPDCDVPSEAIATGYSVFIILMPESKGDAVTLSWKIMYTGGNDFRTFQHSTKTCDA